MRQKKGDIIQLQGSEIERKMNSTYFKKEIETRPSVGSVSLMVEKMVVVSSEETAVINTGDAVHTVPTDLFTAVTKGHIRFSEIDCSDDIARVIIGEWLASFDRLP